MGKILIGQTNSKILQRKLQRILRTNMTDAEKVLWAALRGRQFSGYKFRRQHPFADYILDFVSLTLKLIIEVDGGQHCSQEAYDEARTNVLESAGFRVLRFWNNEVLKETESVREKIWNTIQELSLPSPSQPSP